MCLKSIYPNCHREKYIIPRLHLACKQIGKVSHPLENSTHISDDKETFT